MKTPEFTITHKFIELWTPFGEKNNALCSVDFTRDELREVAYQYLEDLAHEWWPEHRDEYPTYEEFLRACWFRTGCNYAVSMKE